MKLQARQIDAFLKSPDKAARAVLIYGPDQGLVKERAKILGLKIVPDLNDPLNAAHLTGELIEADAARFFDEVTIACRSCPSRCSDRWLTPTPPRGWSRR